MRELTHATCCY